MQRTVWADSYSGMFRSSSAAAAPQRQPLLQPTGNQQKVSPPKKTLTSGLRNLLFRNGEESPEHHGRDDHGAEPPTPPAAPMKPSAPTKIKQVVPEFVPPKPASPPSKMVPAKKGNPRDTFQRANSHPIRLDASAALSASRSFDPSMTRAAALDSSSLQSPSRTASSGDLPQQTQPLAAPSLRSTVFGSCSHVLSTVVTVLFQTIKLHQEFIEPHGGAELAASDIAAGGSKVRQAKLLYIALLEKAQKERGEWQGFASKDTNQASNNDVDEDQEPVEESATDVLLAALTDLTKEDTFAVLHELLELSYRNLRVSLVTPTVYSKHKSELAKESLTSPVSLTTLLKVGNFVNDLNRDEKSCLLRLVNLWHARCIVDRNQQQELRRIVEERYPLILTECSEVEFMQQAARKSARLDPVAVDLLMVMVQHRELLFCDVELFTIRHEMQLTPSLRALEAEETRQPEEPEPFEQPERTESEPEEHHDPAEIDEDLYQDASTQADPPETATQDAETQVASLQTDDAGTQMEEVLTQDTSTQVEYGPATQEEPAAEGDQVAQEENEPNEGGVGIQLLLGGQDMVAKSSGSFRPEGEAEEDKHEQLHDESVGFRRTNLTMAAPPQTEAMEAAQPEPTPKKKKLKSRKTAKKTGLHKSRGRASASTKSKETPAHLQACDSTQTKPRISARLLLPSRKVKRTPRIAMTLEARTHHIHHEVSQPDSAPVAGETTSVAELSPAAETMPRDATITYTHVGLSIAAAALGAVATLALQAIRKPGY